MEHLKICRKKSGLTLDEAAGYLGISRSVLSMYESGQLSAPVTVIINMLRIYRTNVKSLLGVNAPRPDRTEGEKLYDELCKNILLRIETMERTRTRAGLDKYTVEETERLGALMFNDMLENIHDDDLKQEVIKLNSITT